MRIPSCRSFSFGTRLGAKLHIAGRVCVRVGVGASAARRHPVRAKCNFARKCDPKLELGTEEEQPGRHPERSFGFAKRSENRVREVPMGRRGKSLTETRAEAVGVNAHASPTASAHLQAPILRCVPVAKPPGTPLRMTACFSQLTPQRKSPAWQRGFQFALADEA